MADQAFYVRRHPVGGFAVVEGQANETPEVQADDFTAWHTTVRDTIHDANVRAESYTKATGRPGRVVVLAEVL